MKMVIILPVASVDGQLQLLMYACVKQRRARQKLLECTDLGRTEKEFVLNWNSAVHADPIHSDAYTAQACSHFAKEHAQVSTTLPPQLATLCGRFPRVR